MRRNDKDQIGTFTDGRAVNIYRLKNGHGTQVEVMNLGGVIRSIYFRNRDGDIDDIVLGYDSVDDQIKYQYWAGGIIGRYANRIAGGEIYINGTTYPLEKNFGEMTLHGGSDNYSTKLFDTQWEVVGERLVLHHRDEGFSGFPGIVDIWVIYTLTPDDELKIDYKALPSSDTVLNFTQHCYFNLGGHMSGSVDGHIFQINADYYTPGYISGLPTGEIRCVEGTTFDFREPKELLQPLKSGEEQVRQYDGFDHNFCIRGKGFRQAARVWETKSGRILTVYSDLPGMQFFTCNQNIPGLKCKDGVEYGKHGAFCMETQYYPNAAVYSQFESPVIEADTVYRTRTVYRFGLLE